MNITETIAALEKIRAEHGDLRVTIGCEIGKRSVATGVGMTIDSVGEDRVYNRNIAPGEKVVRMY